MKQSPDRILLYCRAGFEGECAQEIMDFAVAAGCAGYPRAVKSSGYVEFIESSPGAAAALFGSVDFDRFIFARQWLLTMPPMTDLPDTNRVTPILEQFRNFGFLFGHLWVESPDTNEGKELATFCKKFTAPLSQALKKERLLAREQDVQLPWAHAFFLDSRRVFVGYSQPWKRSVDQNGIMRLKFPADAPSRSTLKLDEAFLTFIPEGDRERLIRSGAKAVDLGAAPGGWTWQLVRRGLHVTAIDNGPMDAALMASGLVTHKREDGFRYQPRQTVDWMVCDMVERPNRVAELVGDWLVNGWCRQTIFNLKLPMKKRFEELRTCLQHIETRLEAEQIEYKLRARQLYHDREEVTVHIVVKSR